MSLESKRLMPDGLRFVLSSLEKHVCVRRVEKLIGAYTYAILSIWKTDGTVIKAYIADIYILTACGMQEILDEFPDVDCIVVISAWNHYTKEAKQNAKLQGVGIFTQVQFMGALNHYGKRFLDIGTANSSEEER